MGGKENVMKSTSRLTKGMLTILLGFGFCVSMALLVSRPVHADVIVDFDALDTSSGIVSGTAVENYLAGFGITISGVSAGFDPLVGNQSQFGPTPSSAPNMFGTSSNVDPTTYTLNFSTTLDSFSWTRVSTIGTGDSNPAWTLTAYSGLDATGVTLSSTGAGLAGQVPAQQFTVTGPGIASVRLVAHHFGFAAHGSPIVDDWVLTGPCTGVVCSSVCAQCNPANGLCDQGNPASAGTVCRASAGDCDVAESCTGSSATCPEDAFLSSATVCLASAGECDPQETCPGSSATCPGDAKSPNGTGCTSDGNPCTLDQCDGSSALCQHPAGNAGAVCRASAGDCDVAESCTGSSATCPEDAKSTAVCRPAAGDCDVAESCDGVNNTCQADAFKTSSFECRALAGVCDVAENCTGSSAACPPDQFAHGISCNDGDICTKNDACDGSGPGNEACKGGAPACDLVCRGAGFWGTHAGTEKAGSTNITQAVITEEGGSLLVCGQTINTTVVPDNNSAVEALCVSPQGSSRLQLARQLTAAALNCTMTNCDPACGVAFYGDPDHGGVDIGALVSQCDSTCLANTDGAAIQRCITRLSCFNTGGIPLATGFCQTGTCADGSPCNGTTACTCTPLSANCATRPLVNTSCSLSFLSTDPSGSSKACNKANNNTCTIFTATSPSCP